MTKNLLNEYQNLNSFRFGIIAVTIVILVLTFSNPNAYGQLGSNSSNSLDKPNNIPISNQTDSNLPSEISDTSNNQSKKQFKQSYDNNIQERALLLDLMGVKIENVIDKSKAILETTSFVPQIRNMSFINQIDQEKLNGIPEGLDLAKRDMARYLLSQYPENFVSILFQLPNGDVYLLEPFSRQINLTTHNLSFRDYYKNVTNSHKPFLGNVIISASSGQKQAQLAVPLFENVKVNGSFKNSSNSFQLAGILSSGLNFNTFDKLLNTKANLDKSKEVMVLTDGNGTIISSSKSNLMNSSNRTSFDDLIAFKLALEGRNGTLTEDIDGIDALVSYRPIQGPSNSWTLLWIKQLIS
ncbi:MAG TPA: cache domain-containing protein [Nitrososphaeraceae archaeon]|nr:cache domain-containing protein [Nitrososphaeraceae archaeon]